MADTVSPAKQYATAKPAPKSHILLVLLTVLPSIVQVPVNFNIVATAALAVYAGSWRSVKPTPATESMTKSDAMRFPLVGSCVLFGLFLAFKVFPAWLVNALLTGYLICLAVIVLTASVTPYFEDRFPASIRNKTITLPKFKIPHVIDATKEQISATMPELCIGVVSLGFCCWYYATRHWMANNVIGLAFSLEGLEHLSLGSVQTGAVLLCGLFFYDIFWVFCTPVMVSMYRMERHACYWPGMLSALGIIVSRATSCLQPQLPRS